MIRPPLLGVVNAAGAVSARTLTCRAPAVPRSCSMLSVYMAVRRHPVPKLPPLEQKRVRSLDPDIARVEREGGDAFDAVPLEGLQEELHHGCIAVVWIEYIDVVGPKAGRHPRTFSWRRGRSSPRSRPNLPVLRFLQLCCE
jgi:hypothetical protein